MDTSLPDLLAELADILHEDFGGYALRRISEMAESVFEDDFNEGEFPDDADYEEYAMRAWHLIYLLREIGKMYE